MNHRAPQPTSLNTGNYVGTIVAGGRVSIRQKIVTSIRRRPVPYAAAALVLAGLLAWGGYGFTTAGSDAVVTGTAVPAAGRSNAAAVADRSTPEATATGYVAALNDRDNARANQYVCPTLRKEFVDERISGMARGTLSIHDVVVHVTISATFENVTTDGQTPVAHMYLVFTDIPDDTPEVVKQEAAKPDNFNLPLEKTSDGGWVFCEYQDQH